MAVDVLRAKGVPLDRILFLNVIASPEGIARFASRFPGLRIVTAFIDQALDDKKYVDHEAYRMTLALTCRSFIVPGLGDFGDRFYTI